LPGLRRVQLHYRPDHHRRRRSDHRRRLSAISPYAARPWLKHYDYWIRPPLTFPTRSLYEILSITAVDLPDAPATHFLGASLTFREIKARTDRLAKALCRLG